MFYLVLIQKFNDDTKAKALFEYSTLDEAKKTLFSEMFAGMSNEGITAITCEIINEAGAVLKLERWERVPVTEII